MVSKYEVKFFELSRYALQIICIEREKARKYQEGLAPYIKSRIAPFMIVKYEKFTRRLWYRRCFKYTGGQTATEKET